MKKWLLIWVFLLSIQTVIAQRPGQFIQRPDQRQQIIKNKVKQKIVREQRRNLFQKKNIKKRKRRLRNKSGEVSEEQNGDQFSQSPNPSLSTNGSSPVQSIIVEGIIPPIPPSTTISTSLPNFSNIYSGSV
jgi:hypothetical protein